MMSLSEKIDFIFKYRFQFLTSYLSNKNKLKKKRILFYPRLPHHRTVIYKICKELGVKIIADTSQKADLLFVWEDKTFSNKVELQNLPEKKINFTCLDISKETVDKTFESVFGYGLIVDPLNFSGRFIVKSNTNAMHDGREIEGPIEKIEGNVVYQRIIDNVVTDNYVRDIRVPILGDSIPLVYYKFKKINERYTNEIDHVELHETVDVFTNEEINNILSFARAMKLEYGELDILRDNKDGKIYIVDVNKTPWGPPATLSKEKSEKALLKLSAAFKKYFL